MNHQVDVLIVGAGITGLMAADVLSHNKNMDIQLLDKGRSPGGRFATRRIDGGTFDHGAQYITARSESFKHILSRWLDDEWIAEWFANEHPRFIARGGMNQLAKNIAVHHNVEYSHLVESIRPIDEGYQVQVKETMTNTTKIWTAKAVILTCPIPQVFPILKAGQCLIQPEDQRLLNEVKYNPCLAILLKLGEEMKFQLQEGFIQNPYPGLISWIADNQHKGISEVPSWTIHLDPKWSEAHYSDTDESIWSHVYSYLKETFIQDLDTKSVYQVKRWRFAQAYHLINKPFLDIGEGDPLVICGDGFDSSKAVTLNLENKQRGSKIEDAVLSAIETGRYLLERL